MLTLVAHKPHTTVHDTTIQPDLIRGTCAVHAGRQSYVSNVISVNEKELTCAGTRFYSEGLRIREEWKKVEDEVRNSYDYRNRQTGIIYPSPNPAHTDWLAHKDRIEADYKPQIEKLMAGAEKYRQLAGGLLLEYFQNRDSPTVLTTGSTTNHFAYFREYLWASRECLNEDQWFLLASRAVEKRQAKLTVALTDPELQQREPIPPEIRVVVWRRDGGACISCGSRERLEFDHIIPISKGGSNTERNIQLLCESCNRSKGSDLF